MGFRSSSPGGRLGGMGAADGREARAPAVAAPTEPLGGRVRRGLAWGFINSITMRLATLTLRIVLARLLTPEAFGAFAVALVVQTILINFADLGMSADLIRNREWHRRALVVGGQMSNTHMSARREVDRALSHVSDRTCGFCRRQCWRRRSQRGRRLTDAGQIRIHHRRERGNCAIRSWRDRRTEAIASVMFCSS